jgi:FixJ family two-component response regulator
MMDQINTTVYILDDDPSMVKALTRLLTAEGLTVQGFTSAREFLGAHDADELGCLVLDVSMPELNGLELQQHLTDADVLLPIVFLTGHGDIPTSVQAIKAGAVDFLTKPVNDGDLIRAVEAALRRAVENQEEHRELAGLRTRYDLLTPREKEVMEYVVSGMLNKQVARALGTVEQTIKVHRARVMTKMGVDSLADLVRVAERLKLGIPNHSNS